MMKFHSHVVEQGETKPVGCSLEAVDCLGARPPVLFRAVAPVLTRLAAGVGGSEFEAGSLRFD